eukprot:scaffold230861_cov31-Tisochrysis_lutea.AAC.1
MQLASPDAMPGALVKYILTTWFTIPYQARAGRTPWRTRGGTCSRNVRTLRLSMRGSSQHLISVVCGDYYSVSCAKMAQRADLQGTHATHVVHLIAVCLPPSY